MNKKVCIIVMDSAGIGALPDAKKFGDSGSDTIGNIIRYRGNLNIPNLLDLGLANIDSVSFSGLKKAQPKGCFGRAMELFPGKDSTGGHWEIAGLILNEPLPLFPHGFPDEIIKEFENKVGRKVLGNCVASGTQIIEELGQEHMQTGDLIVYTSADSVFQIAMHEEIIPIEQQLEIGKIARDMLTGKNAVGRVIIRPFIGQPGKFTRTDNRKDFSVEPLGETILDEISRKGLEVAGVGKIEDIFSYRGLTKSNHTHSNTEGVMATIDYLKQDFSGLVFANLVEFDALYGHRNDTEGYAKALEQFDSHIPAVIDALGEDDLLIITADHGCDPTTASTDHSREFIPIIVCGKKINQGINLGTRKSFADIAATIMDWLELEWINGESFYSLIKLNN